MTSGHATVTCMTKTCPGKKPAALVGCFYSAPKHGRYLLAQPRMPRVPEGVLTLTSPLPCEANRKAPRVASIATLLVPLFGSYTNLSSRTCDDGPTLRLLLSLNCRPPGRSFPF